MDSLRIRLSVLILDQAGVLLPRNMSVVRPTARYICTLITNKAQSSRLCSASRQKQRYTSHEVLLALVKTIRRELLVVRGKTFIRQSEDGL
ncbi:uncharacterized protein LACBIDRAFT_293117 [Laccaria bicolor S238N-H82]|uniref:Predicted protein n=1 Tax=Laccaria bicolor (strain S238N-H82 / ATCC MYA-4686) TaxID=486041 RepID=B0D0U8_LACBS|nr:uncharacterized protein LACBIDRAFT_293117 [Laccaria bicolor S238N-H82]EDR11884.1 predicted protein [Laccaria bicolor S238N-H82]|eukprot:XP_001877781.1 predicted protein [Laccaria bicolor S238N-H82]